MRLFGNKCQKYQRLISDGLDMGLSPKRRKLLDRHLEKCPHCADRASFYSELKDLAGTLENRPTPVYLWERVNLEISEHPWGDDRKSPQPGNFWRSISTTWKINLIGAAASCLLIFTLGMHAKSRSMLDNYIPVDSPNVIAYNASNEYLALYMVLNDDKIPDEMRDYYLNQLTALDHSIQTIEETRRLYPQNQQVQKELAMAYEKKLEIYCQLSYGEDASVSRPRDVTIVR